MANIQNKPDNKAVVVAQYAAEAFSGPLPHPDILRKYNDVVPGAAERIIQMAENQSVHRKELEKKVIESDIARSKWGQILGFIIAIIGLIGAVVISIIGNAWAGGIIGLGTLGSLVGVFMYGSKERQVPKDNEAAKQ